MILNCRTILQESMPNGKTVRCQLKKLNDPQVSEGLAGNSGEKKGRGAPEKTGDVVGVGRI